MDIICNIFRPAQSSFEGSTFDNSYLVSPFSWIVLLLDTVLWFLIYVYLDSILPSEYGIQQHPLYCLRAKRGKRIYQGMDGEPD